MIDNTNPDLPEETDPQKRIIILTMTGVVGIGLCALFLIAFLWFQPDQTSLLAKYFPSPTPTVRPTSTPAPTRTPAPNLTATQLAWVKPAQPPSLASAEDAQKAIDANTDTLELFANVIPDTPEINQPGDVYVFEIQLEESEPLVWSYGWCTTTNEILEENFSHIQLVFTLNGTPAPLDNFLVTTSPREDGSPCREYAALVQRWPQGQHQLEVRVTFTQDIDDGWNLYPAGTHVFKYIVTVR